MYLKIFAERLSELIFDNNQNAREISNKIGIGKSNLYEYLSAQKAPSLKNLVKIANYFCSSTDFLVGLENEIYPTTYATNQLPFSQTFNLVLKQYNLTRYKLHKITNIAESALYYYAKGTRHPSLENLIIICKAIGCTLDTLLGRTSLK